ncbi:MAG: HAD-IIB family hydrolase [Firmicutes bacterium]|nr:HAD-IIB family hydrolase [Bacillota bacterium]
MHLLFFDIDGTLAIRKDVPEGNTRALALLKEKGEKTFICTGRAPIYANSLFGDQVSGVVCANGRYILYEGKKLFGKAFTPEELKMYTDLIDAHNGGAILVSDEQIIPYHLDENQVEQVKKEYGAKHVVPYTGQPIYTFDIWYKTLEQRDEMMNGPLKEYLVINDHGGHGHGDCSTKDFDKGSAIAYCLEYFHVDKENSYAFGDGYNDKAMFRTAGNKIAMGNAVDELNELATYVTDDILKDGITKALKHYELI